MPIMLLERKKFGCMVVYERKHYRRFQPLLKYVVGTADGRLLEEFRTFIKAARWARANKDG